MDEKLKKLLQDEMEKEAEIIMEAVNKDPLSKDAEAPDSVREKLFAQIRAHEAQKEEERISKENQELIRLGMVYKKKRKRRKYYLMAALFAILLFGGTITTLGGPKRVFQEVKWLLGGRPQTNIDTDDERVEQQTNVTEEEAYQRVEDEFGVGAVRMYYLPEHMGFSEFYYERNVQIAYFIYEHWEEKGKAITYTIYPNNRTSSVANDLEDVMIKDYSEIVGGVSIQIKEYKIEASNTKRWSVSFEYQDLQYGITISGLTDQEFEQVIKNLNFF